MSEMDWHLHFLEHAEVAAKKSKDKSTKIGIVIVDDRWNIVSTGYNGIPRSCDDTKPERHSRPEKYMYFEHGERNAIFIAASRGVSTLGTTMYCSSGVFPCHECARAIIRSGIKRLVVTTYTLDSNGDWDESMKVSRELLEEAGVEILNIGDNKNGNN